MKDRKTKVLFLCTGNSARSQMAEAYLRHHGGDRFDPYSAGLRPTDIHPHTRRVMAEAGVSLDGQRAKALKEYLGRESFGYLITVCAHAEANCPRTFLGISRRLHWNLEDPVAFEGDEAAALARFREIRDEIEARVLGWIGDQAIAADLASAELIKTDTTQIIGQKA